MNNFGSYDESVDQVSEEIFSLIFALHQLFPKAILVYCSLLNVEKCIGMGTHAESNEKIKELNKRLYRLSNNSKFMRFLNVYDDFLNDNGRQNKKLFHPDGLHLLIDETTNAYDIYLKELLKIYTF